ncbi:MAG: hypothetical protein DI527_00380 [Chelatococcus sp.]|nr:MAG: hypothetical protein DI527_00380 [Chelatococcus sp.]
MMLADTGANVLMVFRPDDQSITTIEAFNQVLAEDGCIDGVKWKFRASRDELTSPKRVVLGLSGIVCVEYFNHACSATAPEPRDGE